jgi:tRNA dimethylallyltransferase
MRFDAQLVGVRHELPTLHERIGERVRNMFAAGWYEEVQRLCELGFAESRPMSSVGYRQVRVAVEAGRSVEEPLIEEVAQATRVFARRQRTWLRDLAVHWLAPNTLSEFLAPREWAD